MASRKKPKHPKKVSPEERLTAVENAVRAALSGFSELKQLLGTKAVIDLTARVDFFEQFFKKLLKHDIDALLGELRAVRHLLDGKKDFKTMDTPAPKSEVPPVPERVL